MLVSGGYRISNHLRDCSDLHLRLGLRFSAQIVQLSIPRHLKPSGLGWGNTSTPATITISEKQHNRISFSSKSHGQSSLLCDCFSQQEDDREIISDGLPPVAGGIVALGKFDALHIGHRELAIQASRVGRPFLLSFAGMAEVLGWEHRAPIVAKCDRKRVLSSWASYCCNMVPEEFQIDFSSVRHLSPQQFVEKLAKEFKVHGVVAGKNYRFGYKAAGDASELVKLCEEYNMEAYIINSVMDRNQPPVNINSYNLKERGQVSSTRVRRALAVGDMKYVSELLGRPHRLILVATEQERFTVGPYKLSAPKSCLLNQAPKEGLYERCTLFLDHENVVQCRVVIDTRFVYVETDDIGLSDIFGTRNLQFLHLEIGDSSS